MLFCSKRDGIVCFLLMIKKCKKIAVKLLAHWLSNLGPEIPYNLVISGLPAKSAETSAYLSENNRSGLLGEPLKLPKPSN